MMNHSDAQNDQPGGSNTIQSPTPEQMIWLGDSSVCSKKLKHYPAFTKEETTITVNSFALIKGEEGYQHIGYVEDLYEDYSGHKMVKVRWFNCSEEVTGIPSHEVMITPHVEVVSAECIDGLATVLTPKHYQQCLAVVSEDFSDGIYMCKKQMKNHRVTSFPVCKLRGYFNQAIFSILNPPPITQQVSSKEEAVTNQQVSGCAEEEAVTNSVSGKKGFGVGEEIEVLSNDSGLRGCWFRCKILKAKEKCLKVVYLDVEDAEDPSRNIEEWIAASGVAVPDKLGMRHIGRHTIRPFPPSRSNACFSIGAAVDVWWCDGWWEGIVVTANTPANDTVRVYFPGENRFQNCEKKNVRSSKDWVDNKWLEIKPKPYIGLSCSNLLTLGSATSQKEEAASK